MANAFNFIDNRSSAVPTNVPQTSPIPGREVEMAQNNAGGYTFELTVWKQLERFLVLGTDGGTYYAQEQDHTLQAVKCLNACVEENGPQAVAMITDISVKGRAIRQTAGIFALAYAAAKGNAETKAAALAAVNAVCRTASTFFEFLSFYNKLEGGHGRAYRTMIKNWYSRGTPMDLVYQVTKYGQRNGWTHRDALRLGRPKPRTLADRAWVLEYIAKGWDADKRVAALSSKDTAQQYLGAFDTLRTNGGALSATDVAAVVKQFRMPREVVEQADTKLLNDPLIWASLLDDMPLTAMIRNLGKMSMLGLLNPLSDGEAKVVEKLKGDLRKARVNPFQILLALKTYSSGKGFRGDNSWPVNQNIVAALDKAFYAAFSAVEPTGARFLLACDVSGSMSTPMANTNLSCCEAVAALSLVTAATEERTHIVGFTGTLVDLGITPRDTLAAAAAKAQRSNFGTTDCAQPMAYALERKIPVDVFVVLTDNETYAGRGAPSEWLKKYRHSGIGSPNAALVVVAMTATSFTIADPKDPNMFDVAGFDVSVPEVIRYAALRGKGA